MAQLRFLRLRPTGFDAGRFIQALRSSLNSFNFVNTAVINIEVGA